MLAYCPTSGVLAVGLAHEVYLWTDDLGVTSPPFRAQPHPNYVRSLSFSSEIGRKSILAVGQQNGELVLWSTYDAGPRFEIAHPAGLSCVLFKPTTTRRPSARMNAMEVDMEDLAVGDVLGDVWYYSMEWSGVDQYGESGGSIVLLARISAHSEQICGLAWSPDSTFLATGADDNSCLLFELAKILPQHQEEAPVRRGYSRFSDSEPQSTLRVSSGRLFNRRSILSQLLPFLPVEDARTPSPSVLRQSACGILRRGRAAVVPAGRQKHRLFHSAAVKAIAFAPWQTSLLATGGGANDHAIHFYHAQSGTCLATINVYAQVTSLIWSTKRPEIVVTFGYAQPEHSIRIAVFSWPSCEQVAAIPWGPYGSSVGDSVNSDAHIDCGRALCAISLPGRPYQWPASGLDKQELDGPAARRGRKPSIRPKEKEGGLWCSRTVSEGCIIVASSDQTVKFHEVWSGPRKSRTAGVASGLFGGSGILEEMEGIENPGREIIR